MTVLDDVATIRRLDSEGMYEKIDELPDQFAQAWQAAKRLTIPSPYINFTNVVILGMGGSAIGGALTKSLLASRDKVPVEIVRDYALPAYVNHNSLVIGVSYSGETEETVTAFAKAADKKAKLIAVSCDGELEKIAGKNRVPFLRITYGAQPRSAIGFLFVPLLAALTKLGLLEVSDEIMSETVEILRKKKNEYDLAVTAVQNPAKRLAEKLADRVVVMMGSANLEAVARRWKTQLNENAKQAAFADVLPELCHNTVAGLDFPKTLGKTALAVVLSSSFDHPRNKVRMSFLTQLLAKKGVPYESVSFEAPHAVAELAQFIQLADYVSYYLALLNGVNPTPVEVIENLKKDMAKHP